MDGSGVQFNDQEGGSVSRGTFAPGQKVGWLSSLAISLGLAKDEKQAQIVLIVVIVVLVVIIAAIFVFSNGSSNTIPLSEFDPAVERQSTIP